MLEQTIGSLHAGCEYARAQGVDLCLSLYLVDNSSSRSYRASVRQLAEGSWKNLFDRVDFRGTERNLGYGAAHNLAIRDASSDYHLVLNPDVDMMEDALLVGLSYLQDNPDVAMINPRATNTIGVPQYLCKRYPSVLVLLLRAFAPSMLRRRLRFYMGSYELHEQRGRSQTMDAPLLSGCCMYARTDLLQRVGGFSEYFFMYFEDFDLSMRLLPLGRLVFLPEMRVVHHGGYSARKGVRHILMFARSLWKFYRRHGWSWI